MPRAHERRSRRLASAVPWLAAAALCALLAAPAHAVSFASGTTDDLYDPVVLFAAGSEFGSGVLIAPDWVLTAGHVAALFAPGSEVFFDPATPTTPTQVRSAAEAFVHPLYDAFTAAHDVGLIRLASPILDVAPLALFDDTLFDPTTLVGDTVTLTGWGGSTSGSFGLTAADVPLADFVASATGHYVTTDFAHQTLPGDSGGPLLASTGLGFGALAVNSFATGSASVATSAGHHRAFVDAHVAGVQWLAPLTVPEPGTALLRVVGLALAGWGRVRLRDR